MEIDRSGRQMPMWQAMTEEKIDEAVQMRAMGWSYRRIAHGFGVSKPTILKPLNRRRIAD